MEIHELKFQTARGAMKLLAGSSYTEIFGSLGITKEEFEKVTRASCWVSQDRGEVRKTLDALCAGVMDVTGVPRFEMPAEYVAAVIVSYVNPTNIQVACRWMEGQRPAEVVRGASSTPGQVDPAQLFVLCCMLYDDEACAEVAQLFEKRVSSALKKEKAA